MSKLRVSLIACLLPAFTVLGVSLPAPQPGGCVAKVAAAISTPQHAVRGSFACLAPQFQLQAAVAGYDGDTGLQQLAKERGRDHARFVGAATDGGYVYELSGKSATAITVIMYLDRDGRVTRIDSDAA